LYRAIFKTCESNKRILKYWGVKVLGLIVNNGRAVGLRSSIGPIQTGQILLAAGIGTMGVFTSTGVQMPPVPEKTYRLVGQSIDKGSDRIVTEYIMPGSFTYRSDAKDDSGFYVRISMCIRKGQQTSVGEAREFVVVNNNGSSDRAAIDAISRHLATRMSGYQNLIFDNLISRFNCFIPDGLPIVGPAPNVEALFFALYQRDCRSMIGPALGDLAARTMIARKTLEGMENLSPERFPQSAPGGRKKSFGE
jgi:glycine/D-amino acid oxidase-like deaminating enzyme